MNCPCQFKKASASVTTSLTILKTCIVFDGDLMFSSRTSNFLFIVSKFSFIFSSCFKIAYCTGSMATPRRHFLTHRLVATTGTSPWSVLLMFD